MILEKTMQPQDIVKLIGDLDAQGARNLIRANIIEGIRIGNNLAATEKTVVDFLRRNPSTKLTQFGEELLQAYATY